MYACRSKKSGPHGMTEDTDKHEHNEPVIEIERDGVFYTLLGTAHVSRTSAETVTRLAETGHYDAISVELCENRHQALTADRRWTEMNLFKILREGKAGMIMASLAVFTQLDRYGVILAW